MKINEAIKKEILDIIFNYIDAENCTVFLFGSYAKDSAKQSSDIDVGFVSTQEISSDIILDIKEILNEKVNTLKEIDLVDFSSDIDIEFKKIALKDIKIWHQTKESLEILNNIQKL